MFSRRLKNGYLVLEGLNSFATSYYFFYFYFFMQKQFGFDNKANLTLAAFNGGTYAISSFFAGKFAQRFGYFTALKLGWAVMAAAMVCGLLVVSAMSHVLVMLAAVVGMSFTWPALEALVSEGEPRLGVQHMVGLYNVVWAATAAVGNFTGGAMLANLGLKSLFYVPMVIQLNQIGLTFWLEGQIRAGGVRDAAALRPERSAPDDPAPFPAGSAENRAATAVAILPPALVSAEEHPHPPAITKAFLRMAWLANPFAYIAINTLIAVMPGIALRLGLPTTLAGFCCSVWCFSRFGAFFGLWLWNGWHYRFRWLLLAYLLLAGSFITVLLAPNVVTLVLAQLAFGGAAGLIYFSSLYYSMDTSETKGEHGGFHEAAIGVGNFAGPAVGAAALQFLPGYAHSGAVAVTRLLLCGRGGLAAIWRSGKRA